MVSHDLTTIDLTKSCIYVTYHKSHHLTLMTADRIDMQSSKSTTWLQVNLILPNVALYQF